MTLRRLTETFALLLGAAALGLLLGDLVAHAHLLAEVTAAQAPALIERF